MPFRPIRLVVLLILVGLGLFSASHGQGQDKDPDSWQMKLYEKDVAYEKFACNSDDAGVVASFFKEPPLRTPLIPICHNDCPVITCRPLVPFPKIATAGKVRGTISVHVLVDEQGKTLYARVLEGSPLLWATARKAACATQFVPYPYHKRQAVMHFYVDGSPFLGVPYTASEVR